MAAVILTMLPESAQSKLAVKDTQSWALLRGMIPKRHDGPRLGKQEIPGVGADEYARVPAHAGRPILKSHDGPAPQSPSAPGSRSGAGG